MALLGDGLEIVEFLLCHFELAPAPSLDDIIHSEHELPDDLAIDAREDVLNPDCPGLSGMLGGGQT